MAAVARIGPLSPGSVLQRGRYTLERVLGEGGFGYVYLAGDTRQNRQVAIKQCIDLDSETVSQFGHEFAVLKLLAEHSSFFPEVYDDFSEAAQGAPPGAPEFKFGVMEYVPGKTLQALLDERMQRGLGPFGETEVIGWVLQLLDALEHAHNAKIIHRDVKPSNIMLLPGETRIKVIDVGIAKIGKAGVNTQRGAAAASPGYSPIEQYAQAGRTDRGTDVYAAGATMYALLTGAAPLEAPVRNNQALPPPSQLNPQLSQFVEGVILRALEMDIARRFATAADMSAALQGKALTIPCPSCGHANAPNARFCQRCGAPLQAVALMVASAQVNTLAELPVACDHAWSEGVNLLISSRLQQWLQRLGPVGAPALDALTQISAQYSNNPNLQLDALLRFIQPQRPLPKLNLLPPQTPPIVLEQGGTHTTSFTVTNPGQGILAADLRTNDPWVTVKPAQFHCLPGEQRVVQAILDGSNLAGTAAGKPYMAEVAVHSNAGQESRIYNLQVTTAPRLAVSAKAVTFGAVQFGQQRVQRTIQIGNESAGALAVIIQSSATWLQVAPANVTLAGGHSQPVTLQIWFRGVEQPGEQAADIYIQAGADEAVTVKAATLITGPYQLSCDPSALLNEPKDLVAWCDGHWPQATQLAISGELYSAVRYMAPPSGMRAKRWQQKWPAALHALQTASTSPDIDIALETALRALGAATPLFEHNWPDVEGTLGLGLRPSIAWFRPGKSLQTVEFRIRNCGCLHGCLQSLVAWLSIDCPNFRCFPQQEARIVIHVNPRLRHTSGLRMKLVNLQIN